MGPDNEADGPHAGQPILTSGAAVGGVKDVAATGAFILLHGRGGSAGDILGLADQLAMPHFAALAPEATGHAWYPYRFIEPAERNEPYLSSALAVVSTMIARLIADGIPGERIVLVGFSQGACLALESAARYPGRLGAVIGFSGGLIGEQVSGDGLPRHEGLPVFLGCSERDPHIPLSRVHETQSILRGLGANVTTRITPGATHTITEAEIAEARRILASLA